MTLKHTNFTEIDWKNSLHLDKEKKSKIIWILV